MLHVFNMKKITAFTAVLILTCLINSCSFSKKRLDKSSKQINVEKKDIENKNSLEHHIGEFGDSMEIIRRNLKGRYSKLEERELQIILSTAKKRQTQLECYDFVYRGKKRFVELMFSDNKLEVIHIMKTEEDHDELKIILADKFGKPSYSSSVVDYYAAQRISLRSKPYEISFHSEKIKDEYDGYMKSLN
jgi:hypothetical protein